MSIGMVWDDDVELAFLGRPGRLGAVSNKSSVVGLWVLTVDGCLTALERMGS